MPRWAEKSFTGWGRVLRSASLAARPERQGELPRIFEDANGKMLLARGAGRSYGDAALNADGRIVLTGRLNRFLEFDPATGRLVAEAGATFSDVISTFLPRGYLPPVTPGTGFATLGGGIANDVHGKNHHRVGSLGQHLDWFDLRLPNGELRRVEAGKDLELFKTTVGGVGLTGVIERLCLRLQPVPSNAVTVHKRRVRDIDHYLEAFAEERDRADYVVGWIDALARGRHLGRGILETATPAAEGVAPGRNRAMSVPFDLPSLTVNPLSVRLFNETYFRHVPAVGIEQRMEYSAFLFPLDALHNWNRIYGKRGFHQFQCVVPFEEGAKALAALLETISGSLHGSILAVIKALGEAGLGYLSFPRPGYTLALDFPNTSGAAEVIARLERITCDFGGRTYLAKDSTLTPENLRRMYPDLERFQAVLESIDPGALMQSDMSRRLRLREAGA